MVLYKGFNNEEQIFALVYHGPRLSKILILVIFPLVRGFPLVLKYRSFIHINKYKNKYIYRIVNLLFQVFVSFVWFNGSK